MFDVTFIENFSADLTESRNISYTLKGIINNECTSRGIKTAVYGCIKKNQNWYNVNIVLYLPNGNEVISNFTDKIYTEDGIELSSKDCAIEFAATVSSKKGTLVLFSSAMCPGLRHLLMKKYTKTALYMSTFAFLVYKYTAIDKKININESRFEIVGAPTRAIRYPEGAEYYIDGVRVTREVYEATWKREIEPLCNITIK